MVEGVFLSEKIFQLGVAGAARLVQKTDIAACAKGTKRTLAAIATNGHGQHLGVVFPGQQHSHQIAHHA